MRNQTGEPGGSRRRQGKKDDDDSECRAICAASSGRRLDAQNRTAARSRGNLSRVKRLTGGGMRRPRRRRGLVFERGEVALLEGVAGQRMADLLKCLDTRPLVLDRNLF